MSPSEDDPFLYALAGLAALFLVNRLAVRRLAQHPKALGAMLAVDVGVAIWVAVFGLPGLPHGGVRWLIVAALAIHVVVGLSTWDRERSRAP